MKISEKTFILVTESSDTIIVDDQLEELLRKEMRPILWFRDGLFCVVPAAILMNILEQFDMYTTHPSMMRDVRIYWNQRYQISDEAGRSLSGLEN